MGGSACSVSGLLEARMHPQAVADCDKLPRFRPRYKQYSCGHKGLRQPHGKKGS